MFDIDASLSLISAIAVAVTPEEVEGPWIKLEQRDDPEGIWCLEVVDQNDEPFFEHQGSAYLVTTVRSALEKLTAQLKKKTQDHSLLLEAADKALAEAGP
jgi:hypothetical protein